MNAILLADLHLELGEREAALMLVRDASGESHGRDLLARLGLDSLTTAPLAISVYVRTGNFSEATEIALQCGEREPLPWKSLGVFSGQEGETRRVEKLLDTIQNERVKALVCAGVAEGIYNKQHRQ